MIVKARLYAFKDGQVREIDVPDREMFGPIERKLERVYYWGQNDFQPRQLPSLSVGDVVELEDKFFLVNVAGFRELTAAEVEEWAKIPQRDKIFHEWVNRGHV